MVKSRRLKRNIRKAKRGYRGKAIGNEVTVLSVIKNPLTGHKLNNKKSTYRRLVKTNKLRNTAPTLTGTNKRYMSELYQRLRRDITAYERRTELELSNHLSFNDNPELFIKQLVKARGFDGKTKKVLIHFYGKSVFIPGDGIVDWDETANHEGQVSYKLPIDVLTREGGEQLLNEIGLLQLDNDLLGKDTEGGTNRAPTYMRVTALTVKPYNIRNVKMKGSKLKLTMANFHSYQIKQREGQCVVDYIFFKLKQHYKKLIRNTFNEKLDSIYSKWNKKGFSINHILQLQKVYPKLGIYAYSPYMELICKYRALATKHEVCNCIFIVNNEHCYPLCNDNLEHTIGKYKKTNLKSILQLEKIDIQFSKDNFEYYSI